MEKMKVAVLASGRGSNMEAIINAAEEKNAAYEVTVVISDNEDAPALVKAEKAGIPALFVNPAHLKREEYDKRLLAVCKEYSVDLIALAGFMRLLGREAVNKFRNRIVNIHPALLPSFPGLNAQKQALDYGVKYSGCTVHFVDEGMDTGPIIDQAVVPVKEDDTVETLSMRILQEEHRLYPAVIDRIARGKVMIEGRRVSIVAEERYK